MFPPLPLPPLPLPSTGEVRSSPVLTTPPRASTAAEDDTICTEVTGVVARMVVMHQSAAWLPAGVRSALRSGRILSERVQ